MIASDRSDSGKTIVSSIIAHALSRRLRVRMFKVGPDYIDPGYHQVATGSPSVNLDVWLMGEDGVRESFCRYMRGFDLGIVEGVMGLYDGMEVGSSTFHVAKILGIPVILVIDCSSMSYTAGAVVKGLAEYGPVHVTGVIFNKVASEGHYRACSSSLPSGIRAIGYVPYDKGLVVESRHLGLITVEDYGRRVRDVVEEGSRLIKGSIDLDKLIELAKPINCGGYGNGAEGQGGRLGVAAVAYDNAFSFYYRQSIDLISSIMDVRFFSPLHNETVSGASLIYIGGGYPELHLNELEGASDTARWIRDAAYSGVPIIAECGGLMYLSRYIRDGDRRYRMVGLFDLGIVAKGRLTIGYTELEAVRDNAIAPIGLRLRGHEFHVSYAEYVNEQMVFRNIRGRGILNGMDGVSVNNAVALYSHLYLPSISGLRGRLINLVKSTLAK